MVGLPSRDKFDYVLRKTSMDFSLLDKEFDNTVVEDLDGEFKLDKRAKEMITVKTVKRRRRLKQQ